MTPRDADELWDLLGRRVEPDGLRWLEEAVGAVRRDPAALARTFPAVGRRLGRGPLAPPATTRAAAGEAWPPSPESPDASGLVARGPASAGRGGAAADPGGEYGWTVDDAGRVLLVLAAGEHAARHVGDLYRFGDAAERRAVLRSLALLPASAAEAGLPLVEDAVRTNDPRLVAAALGPYGLDRLDDGAVGQAVLKCVFVGVPLAALPQDRLARRATPALARMLAGYVRERVAAGRDVPADVWPLIEAHPPADELAAIEAELRHPVPSRRAAAAAALAQRAAHRPDGGQTRCASSSPTST